MSFHLCYYKEYNQQGTPSSVKVSTIHSSRKKQYNPPATTTTPIIPSSSSQHLNITSFPLLPFPLSTSLTSQVTSVSTSTRQHHQSKTTSFSINDLLAKEPPTKTHQHISPYPCINPSLLLMYQQWITQQLASVAAIGRGQTHLFQGEPAETDSKQVEPLLVPSSQETAVRSPMRSSSSLSRNSSHDSSVEQHTSEEKEEVVITSVTSPSDKGDKQNALLQVGEAHLAILPDEDGDT